MSELELAMCSGKDRLAMSLAWKIARRMRRRGRNVSAYRCRVCHCWHVGRDGRKR